MGNTQTTSMFDYSLFTERNRGYIPAEVQEKIRTTTLLIAGCGVGSGTAICAARMGFEKFILVDGDTVGLSNLNRQFFDFDDIDSMKVDALKKHILRINPQAQVDAIAAYLDTANTESIIRRADIIFDTVDFLDLPAILHLHATARSNNKHLFTALNAGFGALIWYFPPGCELPIADALHDDIVAASVGRDTPITYADVYAPFVTRLKPFLDDEVSADILKVLAKMRDGEPCPASQVAPGLYTVAAMATSAMRDVLSGASYPSSPTLLIHSLKGHETRHVHVPTMTKAS